MDKIYYRKKHLQRRKQMDFKEVKRLSGLIMDGLNGISAIRQAGQFFAYMSYKNEVDCYDLQADVAKQSKLYAVPKVKENHLMSFYNISGYDDLEIGSYGIMEPKETCDKVEPKAGDVVIIPGVAFSRDGFRVGYGGGYYDRYMATYPEAIYIGVCFEHQLEDELPVEEFDCKLDWLVTESKIYMYRKNTQN